MPEEPTPKHPSLFPDEQDPFYRCFQTAPILLAVISLTDCCLLEANRMFLRTLGFTRSAVVGKKVDDLNLWVDHADRKKVEKALEFSDRTMIPEIRLRTADGVILHMNFSAERIVIDSHLCILAAIQDVTGRKHAENIRIQMEKLASIERLARGMTRDFDELLTRALDAIGRAKADPSGILHIETAEKTVAEAAALADRLPPFFRKGDLVRQKTPFRSFLEETVRFCAREANLDVEFTFSDELPFINIDRKLFSRMCDAIVANAAEAMPVGRVLRVHAGLAYLETEQVESGFLIGPGRYAKISFIDSGKGIPEDLVPKIFDPFFSTKQAGPEKSRGFGMAFVYSVTRRHGGYVSLTSKKGTGTRVSIYMPVSDETKKELPAQEAAQYNDDRSILLVDENPGAMEKIKELAFPWKMAFRQVRIGESAVRAYKEAMVSGCAFDAVILALYPGRERRIIETLEGLKKADPRVKCLAAVEYSALDYLPDYHEYGFSGVVRKPFEPSGFEAVLKEVLGG